MSTPGTPTVASLELIDPYATHPDLERRIKCPVHDYISLSPFLVKFVDTPQFQRLRYLKQLGTSYFVWSGASHNRFEHCLGVAHLCKVLLESLERAQPQLNITTRDLALVQLAGLCHDLVMFGTVNSCRERSARLMRNRFGSDGRNRTKMKSQREKQWAHEEGSEMMFDDLVNDPENDITLSQEDVNLVKDLIRGEVFHSKDTKPEEKEFLFQIVANKKNGIDVDKLDYFARDTLAVEGYSRQDALRLIHSARVLQKDGRQHICFNIKDTHQVLQLFAQRFNLHKLIYTHKTSRAIEFMLVDAFLIADPIMRLSEQVYEPKKFRFLTDDIVGQIERSDEPELREARVILNRLRHRRLYKQVDYLCIPYVYGQDAHWKAALTSEPIAAQAKLFLAEHPSAKATAAELKPEHIIVDVALVHYGMKNVNPMHTVMFYGKYAMNRTTPTFAESQHITTLLPKDFGEYLLRVFVRDPKYYGVVQAGFRALLQTLPVPTGAEVIELPEARYPPAEMSENADTIMSGTKTPRALTPPKTRDNSFVALSASPCMAVPPNFNPEDDRAAERGSPVKALRRKRANDESDVGRSPTRARRK